MGWRMLAAAPVLALTVAAAASAQAPSPSPTPAPERPTKLKAHKANGIIEAYDGNAHTLTIRDSKGNSTLYVLAPDVQLWVGPNSVSTDVLEAKKGTKATLKYKKVGGVRTASQVRVAAPSTKPRTP